MSYGFTIQVHYHHPAYGPRLRVLLSTTSSAVVRDQLKQAFGVDHNGDIADAFARAENNQDGTGFPIPLTAVLESTTRPERGVPALLVRPDHNYDDPELIAAIEDMRSTLELIRADVIDDSITLFVSAE